MSEENMRRTEKHKQVRGVNPANDDMTERIDGSGWIGH